MRDLFDYEAIMVIDRIFDEGILFPPINNNNVKESDQADIVDGVRLGLKRYLKNRFKYSPEKTDNSTEATAQPKTRTFRDYLIDCDKDAVMEKLHTLLDGNDSGRTTAKVLMALREKRYLLMNSRGLLNRTMEHFNLKCARQGIDAYFGDKNKDKFGKGEIKEIVDIIP